MIASEEVGIWYQSKVSKKIKHCLHNSKGKATGSDSPVRLNSFGWMIKKLATITGNKENQTFEMTSTAFKFSKMANGRIPIANKNLTSHASMIPSRLRLLVEKCLIGLHLKMENIQFILRK